jgi:hypothetical protein
MSAIARSMSGSARKMQNLGKSRMESVVHPVLFQA